MPAVIGKLAGNRPMQNRVGIGKNGKCQLSVLAEANVGILQSIKTAWLFMVYKTSLIVLEKLIGQAVLSQCGKISGCPGPADFAAASKYR